ncbi:putative addiction module component, TIGR02574 family [Cyclonatronum proteinivorum]|uniref:Putative addiction module component, TIGR02574 family n=1 Tax=Cyclonatronum proteinivorum TaxID=1457365 RepID=A0A345UL88_9BACT|nr:addiction module protein [Cyclonatronum proteinivorum]AXJ01240.1 putative addiction module component, TIGR02574 family [Cyclonatronum proteinivorum]
MITDYKDIQHSALSLDASDRAKLAKKLIESLDQEPDSEVEKAWIAEIKKRKAEIKSGSITPIAGHEVHKAARELLAK